MSDAELQLLVDEQLPTAQTCFFDLYLPAYSNEDIMCQRLLSVINLESWDVGTVGHTSGEEAVAIGEGGSSNSSHAGGKSGSLESSTSVGSTNTSDTGSRANHRRKRKSKSRKKSSK